MRNRFQQFMYGRYGMDQLNRFVSTVALIVLVVSMFIRRPIVRDCGAGIAFLVLLSHVLQKHIKACGRRIRSI